MPYSGNMLNQITFAEHDEGLYAKKVSLVSSATIYAVVDIAAGETVGINSNVTLNPSPNYIGLVSIAQPISTTFSGNVTLDTGSKTGIVGNVTLSDSKGYIGLVSVAQPISTTFSGNVTLDDGSLTGIVGNVTLSDSKTFIGLTTAVPTFISGYTSFATVISATGPATIVVPPAGQKIFVKTIHVSSLGRGEVSTWKVNGTATAANIPWTALSTTGGFTEFWGDNGQQWGLANDGLTFALNGAATVGIGVYCRFAT